LVVAQDRRARGSYAGRIARTRDAAFDVLLEQRDRRIAIGGARRERARRDATERRGQWSIGAQLLRRLDDAAPSRGELQVEAGLLVRRALRKDREQHAADALDIGSRIDICATTPRLLGREVCGRDEPQLRAGALHRDRAVTADHDAARVERAVNHPAGVRQSDGVAHLQHDRDQPRELDGLERTCPESLSGAHQRLARTADFERTGCRGASGLRDGQGKAGQLADTAWAGY